MQNKILKYHVSARDTYQIQPVRPFQRVNCIQALKRTADDVKLLCQASSGYVSINSYQNLKIFELDEPKQPKNDVRKSIKQNKSIRIGQDLVFNAQKLEDLIIQIFKYQLKTNMIILLKINALLSIFCLIFIAASQNDYTYSTYMTQFNRTYQNEEKSQHEAIFYSNYQQIIKLRQQGVDVEVNNFTDWNYTQKKQFFTYKPETLNVPSEAPTPAGKDNKVKLASTMSQFDWRKLDRVTEVKNQKNCGSCWAFSSAALYQSLLAKESNGQKYDISQQYIIQCDKSSSGCDGGFPYNALQFIKKSGVPSEQSYPYKISSTYYNTTMICSAQTPENPFIKLKTQLYDIGHYTNISVSDLEQFLINNGPISVGIDANHTQFYGVSSSGLISCPASNDVNHAVLLVGFNSSHWFIKNSWGTSWGDLGFGYVSKANDCNLRRQVDVPFVVVANSSQNNTNLLNISVLLTDSYGDGWEGSIIGLKQNGIVVASFGQNFTFGYEKGPFSLQIPNNIETQIVFLQKGSYSSQMGFTISISNKTLYTQKSGTTIPSNTIFLTFCPVPGLCAVQQTVTYYMTLKDSYGDGWNGNTFGFRQDGSIIKNFTMSTGRQLGPIAVEIKKFIKVDIVVVVYGSWGEEIGFQLRNGAGYLVANRTAGSKFSATTILGSFCPECVNLVPVPTATQFIQQQRHQQQQQLVDNSLSAYKISTIILAPTCSILILIILFLSIKLYKTVKKEKQAEQAKQPKPQTDGKGEKNEQIRKKVRKHSTGESCNSINEEAKNNQQYHEDEKYGSSKNIID